MAKLDLADLGLRAVPLGTDGTFVIADAGLAEQLERFQIALGELQAAWAALPRAAREHLRGSTLTFGDRP